MFSLDSGAENLYTAYVPRTEVVMFAVCVFCGEQYSAKRKEIGYLSCLECGDTHAQKEKAFKAKCTAPAFNKGAYTYIANTDQVKGIFKCGEYK